MPYVYTWNPRGTNEVSPEGIQSIARGHVLTGVMYGARKATARVTFNVNIAAADTVVINGVTFTCVASGATGNQFNVGGTLSLTMDALAAAVEASVSAAVANKVTATKFGTTGLDLIADVVGTTANAYTLSSVCATAIPTVIAWSSGAVSDAQSIVDTNETVNMITVNSGSAIAAPTLYTLTDGEEGDTKTLHLYTKGTSSNAVVTGTFPSATTATFDTLNEFLQVKWLGGAWRTIVNSGVVIA